MLIPQGQRYPRKVCARERVGCKRRIRPLTRDAVNVPRSPVWAVRSRSCSFESCFDSLVSVRPQMRRMSRSRCCVISFRCSSARWHDLGSPLPIARCSRHLHGCFLVSVGLPSSSRQRLCWPGSMSSFAGTGPFRAAMLLCTTRSIPTLWHSSFASPVRIPGGAISASSASAPSSVSPSRRRAFAMFFDVTVSNQHHGDRDRRGRSCFELKLAAHLHATSSPPTPSRFAGSMSCFFSILNDARSSSPASLPVRSGAGSPNRRAISQ